MTTHVRSSSLLIIKIQNAETSYMYLDFNYLPILLHTVLFDGVICTYRLTLCRCHFDKSEIYE